MEKLRIIFKIFIITIFIFVMFFVNNKLIYTQDNNKTDDGINNKEYKIENLKNLFSKNILVKQLDFENQNIQDIIQTIAAMSDSTIIVSKGVKGYKSYHFRNIYNYEIFGIILKDNNLTYKKINNVIYVSLNNNIFINVNNDLIDLEIKNDSLLESLYELFVRLGKVIIFKDIKDRNIDLNIKNYTLNELIEILTEQYKLNFKKIKNGYIVIPQNIANTKIKKEKITIPDGLNLIKKNGYYFISIKNVNLTSVLENLFFNENVDYSLLLDDNIVIKNLNISNKTFKEVLEIFKTHYRIDFIEDKNFYTVYSSSITQKTLDSSIGLTYSLSNIDIDMLKEVLPKEIELFKGLKFDKSSNRVYIYGLYQEVISILDLIKSIDKNFKKTLKYYHLRYLTIKEFKDLLPESYKNLSIIYNDNYNSIIVNLSENTLKKFENYIKLIDKERKIYNLKLDYISIEDFKSKIPEEYKKYIISENKDNNLIILKAPVNELLKVIKFKNSIDIKNILIKYHILIIQTRNGYDESFLPEYSVNLSIFDSNLFDIISQFINKPSYEKFLPFGKYFSAKLNWAISSNYAKISADSIVYSLNNNKVEFNNSSTFRYREKKYDEEKKEWVDAGVIREISIGFFLNLKGSYNNKGEIILEFSGKVSRVTNIGMIQSDSSVLPMTSEKTINNKFKLKNNKPILAASFKEENEDYSESKIPILSDIPVLGKLFKKNIKKTETVNFYIYILPEIVDSIDNNKIIKEISDEF